MPATPTRRAFLFPMFPVALAVTALLGLGACAPIGLAVGAGAGVGVAAAQERGVAGRTSDFRIEARIFEKFFSADLGLQTDLGVEVYEGRVLLTGATEDVRLADKAVKLAWQVDGVKDVINEIQLRRTGAKDFIRDTWITGQLRSKITFDKEVLAINYAIETVNGRVYIIGIAQHPAELRRVIDHAGNIRYVRDVISHVRVKESEIQSAGG